MPVGEYSFRIQHGIAGGFAPPTPSAIYTFTQPLNSNNLLVASEVREDGKPSLQELAPKLLSNQNEKVKTLVEELYDILKDLPTEQPPGSEDIYGLDTSIAWGSDDLQWMNGGPEGCGGGTSFVQATNEQKAQFRKAVDIVTELTKIDQ